MTSALQKLAAQLVVPHSGAQLPHPGRLLKRKMEKNIEFQFMVAFSRYLTICFCMLYAMIHRCGEAWIVHKRCAYVAASKRTNIFL